MSVRARWVQVTVLLLVAAIAACSGDSADDVPAPAEEATPEAQADDPDESPGIDADGSADDDADEEPRLVEGDDDTTVDAEPADLDPTASACGDLLAVRTLWEDLAIALFADPSAAEPQLAAFVDQMPVHMAAITTLITDDLAADAALMADAFIALADQLADVDPSDEDAVLDLVFGPMGGDVDDAVDRVEDHTNATCGSAAMTDGPPDPCTFVVAQRVAEAAGLGVTLGAGMHASTFDIPGLSSSQCVFEPEAGGTTVLTVETLRVSDVEAAWDLYADNAQTVVDGVDLRGLPDSTLLTESFGLTAIYVFAADEPFGLQVAPGVGADALVDAALAVLGDQH